MPATLASISNGARNGILFKGGIHLENMGGIKALAVDKTGTLTEGTPVVTDFLVREDIDSREALAILATIEGQSTHPLAQAISRYAAEKGIKVSKQAAIEDVPGHGIQATINQLDYKVGKPDFVGREEAHRFADGALAKLASEGKTVTFIRDEQGILGLIALKDIVRDEAKTAISSLQDLGIHVVMLTGDNNQTAGVIAKESGVNDYVAECLPETKVEYIQKYNKEYEGIGMVGDGINDAPALATATVGIAMGDGTDVALETADIVLMKNNLTKIEYAIRMSRQMQRIVKQNIVFSIGVILLLVISNFSRQLIYRLVSLATREARFSSF